jgi:transcriptional regulator with XRE-family HTH domain
MNKRKPSHPPYDKLKGLLTERGLTYRGVASLLGISITSVGQKINGTSDFLLSEAEAIKREYKLERDVFMSFIAF